MIEEGVSILTVTRCSSIFVQWKGSSTLDMILSVSKKSGFIGHTCMVFKENGFEQIHELEARSPLNKPKQPMGYSLFVMTRDEKHRQATKMKAMGNATK